MTSCHSGDLLGANGLQNATGAQAAALEYQCIVTVSMVSHGQEKLLCQLLNDLAEFANGSIGRLVITHNLTADTRDFCREALLDCSVQVENPQSRGFGANHNSAFTHCATEWFAVVNPDIRLQYDVFSRLIARASPADAVLAPALLDPRTRKVAPNRGLLTPWEIFRRRFRSWNPAGVPAWFPGAFLLIRADAFRRVGGFDERYFLYGEDFDLCARLRLAGWRLRYVPEVQVTHAAQRSSHVRWRYLRWHVQSLLRLWSSAVFWRYRALLRKDACETRACAADRRR